MDIARHDPRFWRVRVDLFASDDDHRRVSSAAAALRKLVEQDSRQPAHSQVGADQGRGVARRPVVGLLFWVAADKVGSAADAAVELATRAGADHGVGPELYDVTVIPEEAVALPGDPGYPSMPD